MLRILFLGNSHTARHDVPGTVATLLRSARPGARVVVAREPSYQHLEERASHAPTLELLESRPWDYVVLQAQDYSLSGRYSYPTAGARSLVRRVLDAGARPVLFAEWARRGVEETRRILSTYAAVADVGERSACLPPVPESFDLALGADPALRLHASDGNHSSADGAFLAAAVLAGALVRRPVGDLPAVGGAAARERELGRIADRALTRLAPGRACPVQAQW